MLAHKWLFLASQAPVRHREPSRSCTILYHILTCKPPVLLLEFTLGSKAVFLKGCLVASEFTVLLVASLGSLKALYR